MTIQYQRRRRVGSVAALIWLAACGSSTQPSGPANGNLRAQIDGASWSAQTIVATFQGGILAVAGGDTQGRSFGFAIGPTNAPGTFTVGAIQPTNASLTIVSGSTSNAWMAAGTIGSGTVTVTSLSATGATGTFSFVLGPVQGTGSSGTKTISQGVFDVSY